MTPRPSAEAPPHPPVLFEDLPLTRALWQDDADDLYFLSQATHAFGLAVATLTAKLGRPPTVWFPDYYCDGALALVRRAAAPITFYPVTRDFAPNWDVCREMSKRQPPELFVIVHYFGREGETLVARAFCDQVGALLFEDASHVMRPCGVVGRHGDMTCYSPRKFLPIPDGGLLAVRGRELSGALAKVAQAQSQAKAPAARWVARQSFRSFRRQLGMRGKPPRPFPPTTLDADVIDPPPFEQVWMSRYSRWRIERAIASHEADRLAEKLVVGHRHLTARLAGYQGLQPVGFASHLIPFLTVMRCDDEGVAAHRLNDLRAAGFEAFTWPALPPEVRADPPRHHEALRLRRTLLCVALGWRGRGTMNEFLDARFIAA